MIVRLQYIFILLLAGQCLLAQGVLTTSDAVDLLLQQNYGVNIARNSVKIAENNTSKELNGYRPTLGTSAGVDASLGGSSQTFGPAFAQGDDNTIAVNNAFQWGGNAALQANYTVFDRTRDYTYQQLQEQLTLSDLELRQTIETNILQLFNAYYQLAQLSENLTVQERTVEVDKQRKTRAEYRFEFGQGAKLDVLNAEVDIQRDSVEVLNLQQQINNTRRNINVIIGREVNTDFAVDTEVTYDPVLSLEQLVAQAKANNIQLLAADQNLKISAYDMQLVDATGKPTVNANASYTFSLSDLPDESFTTFQSNRGLGVGLTLGWNIFDGGVRKVRRQNVGIALESQSLQRQQVEAEVVRDLTSAWDSYQNALFILRVEENNIATAQVNFERTEEFFKTGSVTSIEFRQAQLNLLNAERSYNNAKYNAKLLEVQLLQLSGGLLKGVR